MVTNPGDQMFITEVAGLYCPSFCHKNSSHRIINSVDFSQSTRFLLSYFFFYLSLFNIIYFCSLLAYFYFVFAFLVSTDGILH